MVIFLHVLVKLIYNTYDLNIFLFIGIFKFKMFIKHFNYYTIIIPASIVTFLFGLLLSSYYSFSIITGFSCRIKTCYIVSSEGLPLPSTFFYIQSNYEVKVLAVEFKICVQCFVCLFCFIEETVNTVLSIID